MSCVVHATARGAILALILAEMQKAIDKLVRAKGRAAVFVP